MMRKFTYYLLAFFAIFFVNGCNEEDVSSPPSSSFTVDKTSGLTDTEFTFVVNQVGAKSISLLPYGTEHANLGGILITSFTDGKATVKFTYSEVGIFNAVVVTTNFSSDGEEIKRSYSATTGINISSNLSEITTFELVNDKKEKISKDEKIDKTNHTITATVPYKSGITAMRAKFVTSPFATVTVGGTAQTSEETTNNFTSPVSYKVTANDGTSSTTYTVTVTETPQETDASIKSFQAKSIGKGTKDKVFPAFVDNTAHKIMVLLPSGSVDDDKDSLRVSYAMKGDFAKIKTQSTSTTLKQDSLLNLKAVAGFGVSTVTQDSATHRDVYTLQAAVAPTLTITFEDLNPVVTGSTDGFNISLKTLQIVAGQPKIYASTGVLSGGPASITSKVITKVNGVAYSDGMDVDYLDPAVWTVLVTDNILGTYEVTFTASVTLLK